VLREARPTWFPLIALGAAGILFALFAVNLLTLSEITSSRTRIARTRETQANLSLIRASLVDAEAGQRGFLLTGDPTYLEPFEAAAVSLPVSLSEAMRLRAGDPSQQSRIAELDRLAMKKMDELRRTIDLFRSGQTATALAIVRTNEGRSVLDDARRLIVELRAREDKRLEERTEASRRNLDVAMWIDGGAGFGLLVLGFVLFMINRDIVRRVVLEDELREAARVQQQFIGILGHDLRNPLQAISMNSTLLQQQEELSAGQSQVVRRIASSTERMSRMVNQLLDMARARLAGGIPVERKPETNLSEVVDAVVEELRAGHPEARLALEAPINVQGSWDPDRMAQVVSNLVANAILYGDGSVEVRLRSADGFAFLEVQNRGRPIPAELLPRIFEPFRRGARETRAQGLGLGLFITERIVAAHGGKIDVRSGAEETKFSISLPLQ